MTGGQVQTPDAASINEAANSISALMAVLLFAVAMSLDRDDSSSNNSDAANLISNQMIISDSNTVVNDDVVSLLFLPESDDRPPSPHLPPPIAW